MKWWIFTFVSLLAVAGLVTCGYDESQDSEVLNQQLNDAALSAEDIDAMLATTSPTATPQPCNQFSCVRASDCREVNTGNSGCKSCNTKGECAP